MAKRFNLQDPDAPTRVSGFWRQNLEAWAARRNTRLQDVGGHLPYRGVNLALKSGQPGGVPRIPPPVNLLATRNPILPIPAGLAARAEFLRRETRRNRTAAESIQIMLNPGFSGLDYAAGPRYRTKPGTNAYSRGALRDMRRPPNGVQYYGQETAPASTVRALTNERILADPEPRTLPGSVEYADPNAAKDFNVALRTAVKTNVAPAVPNTASSWGDVLPLVAVAAAFFLVFKGGH